jgi:hypothetical protein
LSIVLARLFGRPGSGPLPEPTTQER